MKSRIMVLGVMIMLFHAGYVLAEEVQQEDPTITESSENAVTEEKKEAVKFCPVCGPEEEMHGLALGYKYKGKKYKFCSMDCLKAFKNDPEQFVKKINEQEDEKIDNP